MAEAVLKGLTWDHPRGFRPLEKGVPLFQTTRPDVSIQWDKRSLKDFGEASLEAVIRQYDLIVMDHPHVGEAAAREFLLDFSHYSQRYPDEIANDAYVGRSWESYWINGKQLALPLDAATQVAVARNDRLEALGLAVPRTFDEVLAAAERCRGTSSWVAMTGFPTDAISLVISLAAELGHPIDDDTEVFLGQSVGDEVLTRVQALAEIALPDSLDWNPIQLLDAMSERESGIVYCPYTYGYTNYAREEASPRLSFHDAPGVQGQGTARTQLGGAGIAISAFTEHPDLAVTYAAWLCSGRHQAAEYFAYGGQPANLAAWRDTDNDRAANGFFSNTLKSHERAHMRPRFDGWLPFFESAGVKVNAFLHQRLSRAELLSWLNKEFEQTLRRRRAGT
ncbi:extracellular solute-binding protein [Salinicola sp. MIT1003]|uniref:ABC transporter substrate-binding protein n=1 Tax=Salinicola sp. MIT1003 TaxID=1882734 RepID=UPI0008DD7853|nr:extracellular solute-binding protein [Salinicola sp. MIT1003]OHZ00414.1 hypothetical protein BC443_16775 [Salinicola sp. MIT1003]